MAFQTKNQQLFIILEYLRKILNYVTFWTITILLYDYDGMLISFTTEMGCTTSVTYKNSTKIKQNQDAVPKAGLTEKEKCTVKETWSYMTKDISGNGLHVFLRIFELCPEAKKLFKVENVRPSELARNQVIRSHGTSFMNAIGAAVDSLDEHDDEHENLNKVFFVLGQQHKPFSGFKPEYFEAFYEALMYRWRLCMGDNFTPEVSETWSHVFVYMMEKLKEGYFSKESQ